MKKPTKKTEAPKKAKRKPGRSRYQDLLPDEKQRVDELCALWQRVLDYRCGLIERIKSEGDWAVYNRGTFSQAIDDLCRFDRYLLKQTKGTLPTWIDSH